MSNPAAFSLGRVGAMVLRYTYLLRSSWPRLLEMIYWPAVQMLTWGFLQTYLVQAQGGAPNSAAIAAGALIGGVLLWDILLRGQQGFSFSFLEEMWSRNIPNLLMSPLRPAEFVVALMVMSLIRLAVGVVPVTLMAIAFFGFNLWALDVAFGAFFVVLIFFAWSVGLLVSGILLRYGLGAENLVWSLMFIIQPLGCVYYPVAALPGWLHGRIGRRRCKCSSADPTCHATCLGGWTTRSGHARSTLVQASIAFMGRTSQIQSEPPCRPAAFG